MSVDPDTIPMILHPLNTILYGPPGTGKTYTTLQKAVDCAEPDFKPKGSGTKAIRDEYRECYERLREEGRIQFITFHQSFSYEDFIEGIKPVKPEETGTYLKYETQAGIFKRLVDKAKYQPDTQTTGFSISDATLKNAQFFKMSLGTAGDSDDEAIYRWCMDKGYVALGWGDDLDFTGKTETEIKTLVKEEGIEMFAGEAVKRFIHWIHKDDFVLISDGNLFCRAIGKITGDYEYRADSPIRYHHFRKTEWLLKDVKIPVGEIYSSRFSMQSIYQLANGSLKKEFFLKPSVKPEQEKSTTQNFVLIIDEINRGNVSQIFGELITLIEEDKRAGREEALEVTLPYSGEKFSVPPNLYLIGTMNTADRSVEALDTALRRRFSFIEMPPDEEHELIDRAVKIGDKPFDFSQILRTINTRMEVLAGRDHKIGHSYFLNLGQDWKTYLRVFTDKIIPLLQEYFYGDYSRICLVLGEGFVKLERSAATGGKLFADLPKDSRAAEQLDALQEKEVWQLTNWNEILKNETEPNSPSSGEGRGEASFAAALDTLLNAKPKDGTA